MAFLLLLNYACFSCWFPLVKSSVLQRKCRVSALSSKLVHPFRSHGSSSSESCKWIRLAAFPKDATLHCVMCDWVPVDFIVIWRRQAVAVGTLYLMNHLLHISISCLLFFRSDGLTNIMLFWQDLIWHRRHGLDKLQTILFCSDYSVAKFIQ